MSARKKECVCDPGPVDPEYLKLLWIMRYSAC